MPNKYAGQLFYGVKMRTVVDSRTRVYIIVSYSAHQVWDKNLWVNKFC